MKLVVVGAHAMDAELMAGCLVARAVDAGWSAWLVHLTLGERGHPDKDPATFAAQLQAESRQSAAILGCQIRSTGLAAPLDPIAARPLLAGILGDIRPDLVVTHWSGSWHPSHRAAHEVTVRCLKDAVPTALLAFGENCEDLAGFVPTDMVDASAVRRRYLDAAACYELFRRSAAEFDADSAIPYQAYYGAALRVRGRYVGFAHAQAFMSPEGPIPASLGSARLPNQVVGGSRT